MMRSASWIAALPLFVAGCDYQSHLAPHSELDAVEVSTTTRVEDTFWQIERHEEATRPRLRRPQTISLGEIGDAPLTNGVTRDSR